MKFIGSILLLLWVLVACTPAQQAPTPIPTLTLIAATSLPTVTPVTPTAIVPTRTNPLDLISTELPDATQNTDENPLLEIDPVAGELVALAKQRIENQENISVDQLLVASIEAYRWQDTSLGCPLLNNTYEQVEIAGYRIVLQGMEDDLEFIFHTSFDQITRCDIENEQLP